MGERLIILVRQNPALYDKSRADYMDSVLLVEVALSLTLSEVASRQAKVHPSAAQWITFFERSDCIYMNFDFGTNGALGLKDFSGWFC